ncbi:Uma2 family endonuclease [Actinoallomurus vinaceus]|uniref:Uma2 family endonuclease n=1 Tax=Actinoallomurus vinaceus TaxID=1080074 RepID=UPI003CD0A66E
MRFSASTASLREPARAAGFEVVPAVEVFTTVRPDWQKVPDIVVVPRDVAETKPRAYEAEDVALVVEVADTRQARTRDAGEKREARSLRPRRCPRFPGRGIDVGEVPGHTELVVQFSLESKTCLH